MRWVNRISQLFQPSVVIPKQSLPKTDVTSKSYQLMINAGIISNVSTGMYAFLPLGLRALEKLIKLIDEEMTNIGGQKILLPVLTATHLWHKTSRLEQAQPELFILHDRRGKEYLLSPTFEETITNLISQLGPLTKNQLPLRLYQTSSKWRDEMKPRLGLLRSREFVMKDMYTFDVDSESAKCTYEVVNETYSKILNSIGIPYVKVIADTGIIGGSVSHEYHYVSNIGEDTVSICKKCNYYDDKSGDSKTSCPRCNESLEQCSSVESYYKFVEGNNEICLQVGHTFLLGTKYSEPLKATFIGNHNKKQLLEMGCYGLGLTRIIATTVEILSTDLEIRWPLKLAPYSVCIIPPKKGSKEESASKLADDLYFELQNSNVDVIMDDRTESTIGKRFIDARKCGYPFVVIVGKTSIDAKPLLEVHEVYKASYINLAPNDIVSHLKKLINYPSEVK